MLSFLTNLLRSFTGYYNENYCINFKSNYNIECRNCNLEKDIVKPNLFIIIPEPLELIEEDINEEINDEVKDQIEKEYIEEEELNYQLNCNEVVEEYEEDNDSDDCIDL